VRVEVVYGTVVLLRTAALTVVTAAARERTEVFILIKGF
jgi:hypothetical protein